MVDKIVSACAGEWYGRREPMGESDRERYCIDGRRDGDKE